MRISRNSESGGRPLSTADLAAAARRPEVETNDDDRVPDEERVVDEAGEDLTPTVAVGRRPVSADDSGAAHLKERSAERVVGRPAADDYLRASQVEADVETRRTDAMRAEQPPVSTTRGDEEALVALFTSELAETYRSRWISIQSSFVDDPKEAVRSGDELVAQVMGDLANSFAEERHRVEAKLDESGEGSTENLRVALRRYRSFFDRLLSL